MTRRAGWWISAGGAALTVYLVAAGTAGHAAMMTIGAAVAGSVLAGYFEWRTRLRRRMMGREDG